MPADAETCSSCLVLVPAAARFCPACGNVIGRTCSACHTRLVHEEEPCPSCGMALDASAPHLDASPGERKNVTILFSDTVGSTGLLSQLDLEEGRWLLEAVVGEMGAAVRAFGGVVSQINGDGLMALFGAPQAIEDHAMRACCAALRMQEAIGETRFVEKLGLPVSIRIGLHSGEVVVAERGNGFNHYLTAFGVAAHLAARLEQLAGAGQVCISADTHSLVAGRIEAERMPAVSVKGFAAPVETWRLTGIVGLLPAPPPHGVGAPFIGRDDVLGVLRDMTAQACTGRGIATVISGDPGSGKTRLCMEVFDSLPAGWRSVQVRASSFPPPPPYRGIVDLLRACMADDPSGSPDLYVWLDRRTAGFPEHADALRPLFLAGSMATPVPQFRQRQAQVALAVTSILRRLAHERPMMVLVDDLQWIDPASNHVLAALAQSIRDVPMILLATARVDGLPAVIREAGPRLITLPPFTAEETLLFLNTVPDTALLAPAGKQRLFRLTGGNALFLEELIKSQTITGLSSDPKSAVAMPSRVQDLLTMRVDRLSAAAKAMLQAAAVLGMEFERVQLSDMAGHHGAALALVLAELHDGGFLRPMADEMAERWSFHHVLGRDAAYSGLLRESRWRLHARALRVLERADGQDPSVLTFHARESQDWHAAHRHGVAAGLASLARSAPHEAMQFFEDALDALRRLDAYDATRRSELDLRFLMRNTLFSLGRAGDIGEHLAAASALAELLGDDHAKARALCQGAHLAWQMGRWTDAIATGTHAMTVAEGIGNVGLAVSSRFFMGLSTLALGQIETGADLLRHNVSILGGDLARERFGFVSICSVVSGAYLAVCLTELGRFDEAEQAALAAQATARQHGLAFDQIQADLALAGVDLMRGDSGRRIELLERALSLCRTASVAVLLPRASTSLAFAYALAGRSGEVGALVVERDEQSGEAVRAMSLLAGTEAMLLSGDVGGAEARAAALIAFARRTNQAGAEAWGQLMYACCLLAAGRWVLAIAAADAAAVVAAARTMRPLAARASLVSAIAAASLDGLGGSLVQRHGLVRAVAEELKDCGMAPWISHMAGTLASSLRPGPASQR